MSSEEDIKYVAEWECDEGQNEEFGIEATEGEEAGRGLTRIETAWNSCEKLKTDATYHQRYIPINDAFGFRYLPSEDKESFVKDKALTEEDKAFLCSEQAVETLEQFSDAVVCITVKLGLTGRSACGTGFYIRINDEDVIITNSHSIRSLQSGNGVDFRIVKPADIRVVFFYTEKKSSQVIRVVTRIDSASPPDKNKDGNVLMDTLKAELHGNETSKAADVVKCDIALGLLSSYFSRRDAFLDYALLYLKPLQSKEQKVAFAKVRPLEMKAFDKLENFRNVSSFGFPDPRNSKNPRSLRLFSISHPHRASKQISFGGMLSDLTHVYFLNMAYGQNDTGMLGNKEPFAEHSIPTCKGSSGAPIFVYIFNHETEEIVVDKCVYFLHFFGDELDGIFRGKSVSFSTIIRNLERQALHNQLGDALKDVANPKEDDE